MPTRQTTYILITKLCDAKKCRRPGRVNRSGPRFGSPRFGSLQAVPESPPDSERYLGYLAGGSDTVVPSATGVFPGALVIRDIVGGLDIVDFLLSVLSHGPLPFEGVAGGTARATRAWRRRTFRPTALASQRAAARSGSVYRPKLF